MTQTPNPATIEDDAYIAPMTADERIDAASGMHEEIVAGEHGARGNPPGVNDFYRWTVR